MTKEELRLQQFNEEPIPLWKKWGTYVAERAWGTVREDYSWNGDAWSYFPHDEATRKAYRWGEDAIAGWCDRYQVLIFSPVFWNGEDPILKERLFGLSSNEGNHGEDVKECYFHLDATPTNSYMKFLYKYPQLEFPYEKLRSENQKKNTFETEYELVNTGIFDNNRYFDIFIEYAKESPEDLCIKIEVHNRAEEDAPLQIFPHMWFRNQWSWGDMRLKEPKISRGNFQTNAICLVADDTEMLSPETLSFDYHLGKRYLYGPKSGSALFTNNETASESISESKQYFKDAFHQHVIKKAQTVNLQEFGTKACLRYIFEKVPAKDSVVLYLRFTNKELKNPLEDLEEIFAKRKKEANQFYEKIHPPLATEEEKMIQRQALVGILWSKQFYFYNVNLWLKGDNSCLPPSSRNFIRNFHWKHLNSMRILCVPDKWEYPYFCAWDHAFHCITLALVDIEFAKEQLWLLLFDQFQHPNGQIPACEWDFSDLNPPVHGWAVLRLYQMEKKRYGKGDRVFLEKCFHKLLMSFSFWVNKVDSSGNNVFEGGFLGLDNITLLDRSQRLSHGIKLQQSDGTGWMAMFCLNLMSMALELSRENSVYESLATKFFQHYAYIANSMKRMGNRDYEIWSEKDKFFYDVLTYPDGKFAKFRVRSLVGIIPIYAVEVLDETYISQFSEFYKNFLWFMENRKEVIENCISFLEKNGEKKYLLSLMTVDQLSHVLKYVWDPNEFRSEFGLRSLSKFHEKHPFNFGDKQVGYEPGESFYKVKGGNSNWRGPVWIPPNFLLADSLRKFSILFQDQIKIQVEGEAPVSLESMAYSFVNQIISLFSKDREGKRPFLGADFPFKEDPFWKDYILFYEYFNSETGKGLGASHQTGWSSLVANLIDEFRR